MNDIMWDSIKPMVFFIAPLGNLTALIAWKRWFYDYKSYQGEEQGREKLYYQHRHHEKNEKKRKRNNRFWLIFLLGSWNLIMLYFILYIIYR